MANFPTNPSVGDLFETKHDTLRWNGSAWEALGRILTHREKSDSPYSSISVKESGGVLDTEDTSTVLLIGESTAEGQAKAAHSSDANTVFLSGETAVPGIAESTSDASTSALVTGERDASLYKMRAGMSSEIVLTEGYSLDGTEDYIEIPSSTDFDFGTGDFTVELWMKSSHSNSQSWTALVDRRGQVSAFSGWLLGLCDGDGANAGIKGRPRFHGAGSDIQLQATTDCLDGYWHHIAISRESGTMRIFVDGALENSATINQDLTTGANTLSVLVGASRPFGSAAEFFDGEVKDVRISKGVARYTASFTTEITTKDSNHKLILDGTRTDSSDSSHSLTFQNGAHEVSKTGNKSWHKSGSPLGYIRTNDSISLDGDFTIEWWYLAKAAGTQHMFTIGDSQQSSGLEFYQGGDGQKLYTNNGSIWTNGGYVSVDTWYHFAVVRSSGVVKVYRDGTQIGSDWSSNTTFSGQIGVGVEWYGNQAYVNANEAYYDDFTIHKTAKYTGAFTPSTTAAAIDGLNTIFKATTDYDISDRMNDTIGFTGNATTVEKGYKLDGTTGYLEIPSSTDFDFGTDDFTVELWMKSSHSNSQSWTALVDRRGQVSAFSGWLLGLCDGDGANAGIKGRPRFHGAGSDIQLQATTDCLDGSWHHIAISRESGTMRIFVDGVLENSSTINQNLTTGANTLSVLVGASRPFGSAAEFFDGDIKDVRISKGIARYTADFSTIVTTKDSSHKLILDGETTDSSDSAHTVSFNGTSRETTKRSDRSLYFDGSGDYVDLQSTSNFAFGTDDFTIETWFRYETADSFPYLFDFRDAGTNGAFPACYLRSDDGYKPVYYVDGAEKIRSSVALSIDTWYHLAISRISGTTTMYLDGASVGSFTDSYDYAAAPLRLGDYSNGGYELTGFLDDFKVSTTGRYTGAFDLDTINNISDQSSSSHTVTAYADAATSTTQKKFGTHSMYFDGTGDYLQVPADSDFNFGTGDFTIEMWINPSHSTGYNSFLASQGYLSQSGGHWAVELHNGKIGFWTYTGTSGASEQGQHSTATIANNTWTHVAIVNYSGTTSLYINGALDHSYTNQKDLSGSGTAGLDIGRITAGIYGTRYFTGYIDELRISNTARYTSAFNLDDVTTPVDKKGTHTVSLNGDALIASSGTSEETKFGGYAIKLDGTGDYLSIASHSDFAFGTDDFTIETWFKYDSANSYPYLLDGRTSNVNGAFPAIYLNSGDFYKPVYWVDGAEKIKSSTGITINTWYHLAIVRSGGTTTMYLDGTSVGSFSDSIDYVACPLRIGDQSSGGAALSGCIDEFRISTNARYTAAFTPQLAEHDLVDVKGWGSPVLGSGERALFVNNNGLIMKSSDGTLTKLDTTAVQSGRLTVGNAPASNSEPTLYTKADGLYYRDPSGVETKIS